MKVLDLEGLKTYDSEIKKLITSAMPSDVAQQTTLTAGVQSILQELAPKATMAQLNAATEQIIEALSHIDIDTTTLAKQGSNPSANISEMDAKLGNVVMMSNDEYAPALEDLEEALDNIDNE